MNAKAQQPTYHNESSLWRQCSVAFLLCDEEEDVFSSRFNFPRPMHRSSWQSPKGNVAPWIVLPGLTDAAAMDFDFDFLNTMLDSSSFAATEVLWPDSLAAVERDVLSTDEGSLILQTCGDQLIGILEGILALPAIVSLSDSTRADIKSKLEFLFTPSRASRLIARYFEFWHRNCRILHRHSLVASSIRPSLLLSMLFLGAMYSADDMEREMANAVVAYAEYYIFSEELFCQSNPLSPMNDGEADFQIVQAGMLMVIVQFWAGDDIAKRRASTSRFNQVVEVTPLLAHSWLTAPFPNIPYAG